MQTNPADIAYERAGGELRAADGALAVGTWYSDVVRRIPFRTATLLLAVHFAQAAHGAPPRDSPRDSTDAPPTARGPFGEPFILLPSPPSYYDLFGRTVATQGDHLAVTSGQNLGRVHLYRRAQQGVWNELYALTAPPGARGFGRILALAKQTLVVSCDDGTAWAYGLSAKARPAKLAMGGGIDGIAATDDVIVLSARGGMPRVWAQKRGKWAVTQDLTAPEIDPASLGGGVARHGNTLVVGAIHHTERAHRQGGLLIYRLQNTRWHFEQIVTAGDGEENHFMGTTVAVFEDVAAATSGHGRGFVYVFRRDEQGRWQPAVKLVAPPGARPMHFASLTMPDANTIIHSSSTVGTFVYRRVQTDAWQLEQSLEKTNAGWRASSSGRVLAVPSANSTVDDVKLAGSVYLFERSP